MKTKNIRLSILLSGAMALMVGCSDFNYNENVFTQTGDEIWADDYSTTELEYSLLSVYTKLPDGYNDVMGFEEAVTDNATTSRYDSGDIDLFNSGSFTEDNLPDDTWTNSYEGIYLANRFLINTSALTTNADVVKYRAEAIMLKAFFYTELIRRYGAVPIITESDATNDPTEFNSDKIVIGSFSDCVDYVAALCDEAAPDLVASQADDDRGRVIAAMAPALKSRLYLYAACLDENNRASYLTKCVTASTELTDATGSQLSAFASLFDASNAVHLTSGTEQIFERRGYAVTDIATAYYPIGFELGQGHVNPSHNLVEAFYKSYKGDMSASTTDIATMYDDLSSDARFATTIAYHGSTFNSRALDMSVGGLDASTATFTGTQSGYYVRKLLNPNYGNLVTTQNANYQNWFFMRYAEVYLNLVEAYYYQGDEANALAVLNVLRGVRGASTVSVLTGDDLLDFIRNERRVEMAFEGQYYFDVKRWSNMDSTYVPNSTLYGVEISASGVISKVELTSETRYLTVKEDFPLPATETLNDYL